MGRNSNIKNSKFQRWGEIPILEIPNSNDGEKFQY